MINNKREPCSFDYRYGEWSIKTKQVIVTFKMRRSFRNRWSSKDPVSKWLKSQGEKVLADEPIVELETDKVNVEVPAPSNGVLEQISVKEGETVNVGALLGMVNGSAKEISEKPKEIKSYSPPKKEVKVLPGF